MIMGDTTLVKGVVFSNDDAANDFTGGVTGSFSGSYTPVSRATVSAVSKALNRSGQDDRLSTLATDFTATAKDFAKQIDSTQRFGWGGRGPTGDAAYSDAMTGLKQAMMQYVSEEQRLFNQILAERIAPPPSTPPPQSTPPPSPPPGYGYTQNLPPSRLPPVPQDLPPRKTRDVSGEGGGGFKLGLPTMLVIGGVGIVALILILRRS